MSRTFLALMMMPAALALSTAAHAQALETDKDRVSYSVGAQFGKVVELSLDRLNLEALVRGLEDAALGKDLALDDATMGEALTAFQQAMQQDREKGLASEGRDYLEANAKKPGVMVTDSGLQYKVVRAGTGATPKATDTVETHYRGTFIDGNEFDSSYSRNEPTSFPVNRVIAGWTEALQLMKEGGKWELFIPFELAYGPQGRQGIPPYSTLLFEIELIRIVK